MPGQPAVPQVRVPVPSPCPLPPLHDTQYPLRRDLCGPLDAGVDKSLFPPDVLGPRWGLSQRDTEKADAGAPFPR